MNEYKRRLTQATKQTLTIIAAILTVIAIVTAAIILAGKANATPQDDAFLNELSQYVEILDPELAVEVAKAVCLDMEDGDDPNGLAEYLHGQQGGRLIDAQLFIEVASDNYCPHFKVDGAKDSVAAKKQYV